MRLPPDYQARLRATTPAGTSAALKTEYLTLATGKVRAGEEIGVGAHERAHHDFRNKFRAHGAMEKKIQILAGPGGHLRQLSAGWFMAFELMRQPMPGARAGDETQKRCNQR